ncbi:MAG: two-component sensor histidine kinase [Planctomycetes bacterium]|nr:two-component sensor histidine kinase [Planctomycetota bacterium]
MRTTVSQAAGNANPPAAGWHGWLAHPCAGEDGGSPVPDTGGQATSATHELAAETITVRIRWFGVCVGLVLVNFIGRETNQPALNALLALGAGYALIDTLWSVRGRVFLSGAPLFVSLMEAFFIGLLCHFDTGLYSPFRFYYFLSLLVCAIRYSPALTWATFLLHSLSYAAVAWAGHAPLGRDDIGALFLMLVLTGWVTWGSTALAGLLKATGRRLSELNEELRRHQAELEQRIAERTRDLQQSQALLVQQEKQAAFGLLAAGIAHEVGNPLASISSLVQMLNRRHADEYTRERLGMVDDQLRRIQRILRELVGFSRPAATGENLCDVREVLDAALSIAKYYKRKKGKRIVTDYAVGLPPIRVIRDQMVQVFLNLVLNAMDATDEGGTIEIATVREGGSIRITVRDDGSGIAADARPSIFQPYFTTKATGTGLGLFVCRHIVEEVAGGRIALSDSSPVGTTFSVLLPAAENAVAERPECESTQATSPGVAVAGIAPKGLNSIAQGIALVAANDVDAKP